MPSRRRTQMLKYNRKGISCKNNKGREAGEQYDKKRRIR
jgi:hypothetical protein